MKHGKKLTYAQKQIISENMLIVNEWQYVSETEFYLKIRNKKTGIEKKHNEIS